MGIDARMFVRVRNTTITDAEMFKWSHALGERFGNGSFVIVRPEEQKEFWPAHGALTLIDAYEQDGPTIVPEPEETFLEVHLSCRYYGIGYERGPLYLILAIADFLSDTIPNCKVWYGGDSSGVCAEELTPRYKATLWEHFVQHGHEPYHGLFAASDAVSPLNRIIKCNLCRQPLVRYGFGKNYAAYRCAGCGLCIKTHDGGVEWTIVEDDLSNESKGSANYIVAGKPKPVE